MAISREALMNAYNGASSYDPYRERYEQERYHRARQLAEQEAYAQRQNNLYGLFEKQRPQTPQPVPQPEPNKVLLLLGEDE